MSKSIFLFLFFCTISGFGQTVYTGRFANHYLDWNYETGKLHAAANFEIVDPGDNNNVIATFPYKSKELFSARPSNVRTTVNTKYYMASTSGIETYWEYSGTNQKHMNHSSNGAYVNKAPSFKPFIYSGWNLPLPNGESTYYPPYPLRNHIDADNIEFTVSGEKRLKLTKDLSLNDWLLYHTRAEKGGGGAYWYRGTPFVVKTTFTGDNDEFSSNVFYITAEGLDGEPGFIGGVSIPNGSGGYDSYYVSGDDYNIDISDFEFEPATAGTANPSIQVDYILSPDGQSNKAKITFTPSNWSGKIKFKGLTTDNISGSGAKLLVSNYATNMIWFGKYATVNGAYAHPDWSSNHEPLYYGSKEINLNYVPNVDFEFKWNHPSVGYFVGPDYNLTHYWYRIGDEYNMTPENYDSPVYRSEGYNTEDNVYQSQHPELFFLNPGYYQESHDISKIRLTLTSSVYANLLEIDLVNSKPNNIRVVDDEGNIKGSITSLSRVSAAVYEASFTYSPTSLPPNGEELIVTIPENTLFFKGLRDEPNRNSPGGVPIPNSPPLDLPETSTKVFIDGTPPSWTKMELFQYTSDTSYTSPGQLVATVFPGDDTSAPIPVPNSDELWIKVYFDEPFGPPNRGGGDPVYAPFQLSGPGSNARDKGDWKQQSWKYYSQTDSNTANYVMMKYARGTFQNSNHLQDDGSFHIDSQIWDIAGNWAHVIIGPYTFIKDTTAPTLSAVSIASNNSNTSLAKVGNEITLSFTSSEVIGTPTVTIAGQSATVTNTGNDWTATYSMASGDPEGVLEFTIDFTDLVGNAGAQVVDVVGNSSSVTFDETEPTIGITAVNGSGEVITSGSIRNDDSLTLTFTPSEVISDFDLEDIVVDNGELSEFSVSGDNYTAKLTPNPGGGLVTVKIDAGKYIDSAGNLNVVAAQYLLTSDFQIPSVTFLDKPITSYTPTITGTVTDPGATIEVIEGLNTYSVMADSSGNWSIDIANTLSTDSSNITITATDLGGNISNTVNGSLKFLRFTSPTTETLNETSTRSIYLPALSYGGTTLSDSSQYSLIISGGDSAQLIVDNGIVKRNLANNRGKKNKYLKNSYSFNVEATYDSVTISQSVTITIDEIEDTDGIPGFVERKYIELNPSYSRKTSEDEPDFDSNGTPDRLQSNIAITPFGDPTKFAKISSYRSSGNATELDDLTEQDYVFIAVAQRSFDSSSNEIISTDSNAELISLNTGAKPNNVPKKNGMPEGASRAVFSSGSGLFEFGAAAKTGTNLYDWDSTREGVQTKFFFRFNTPIDADTYLKQLGDSSWVGFEKLDDSEDGVVITRDSNNHIIEMEFTITDNGPYDSNSATNIVEDPGGTADVYSFVDAPDQVINASDANPPVFSGTGEAGATIVMDFGAGVNISGTIADDGSWSLTGVSLPNGTYNPTVTVTNDLGGTATDSPTYLIDYDKPVITLIGDSIVTFEVQTTGFPSNYTEAGATASDDLDGDISSYITIVDSVNVSTIGQYNVTYNISDTALNQADEVVRTVNIVDTTIPVISISGSASVTIERGSSYTDAGASASDSYDGDITEYIQETSTVNSDLSGSYTVTYDVQDSSQNDAVTVTRSVIVEDTTAPLITSPTMPWGNSLNSLEDDSDQTVAITTTGVEDGQTVTITFTDNGTSTSYTGQISGNASNIVIPAAYLQGLTDGGTITYSVGVSDLAGNAATAATGSFTVDNTAPTVTLTSSDADLIVKDSDNVTITATFSEEMTTAPQITIGSNAAVSMSLPSGGNGTIWEYVWDVPSGDSTETVTVSGTDVAGNAYADSDRLVFTVDNTAPTVTLTSSDADLIVKDSDNVTITATFSEEMTTAPQITIGSNAAVSMSLPSGGNGTIWEYVWDVPSGDSTETVTVSGTDVAGNAYADSDRLVFTVDNTAPVITILGDAPYTLERLASFTDPGVTVLDNIDVDLTTSVTSTNDIDNTTTGTYSVEYTVTDASGNTTQVTRVVNVVDTTPPSVQITADKTSLKLGETATITFTLSEPSLTFEYSSGNTGDISVTGGSLSDLVNATGVDANKVYTAVFTPTPNSTVSTTISVSAGVFEDLDSNSNLASEVLNLVVDTLRPDMVLSESDEDDQLKAGDTALITFTSSEVTTDFDETLITVTGGSLSDLVNATGADANKVWTALFTPDSNSTVDGVISVGENLFSDAAGNQNTSSNTITFSVDTTLPTISISSDDSSLIVSETATLTFTLSEASTDFIEGDITATGGSLSDFTNADSGVNKVWTAVFTPTTNSTSDGVITVEAQKFSDAFGNNNTVAGTILLSIDTEIPVINSITTAWGETLNSIEDNASKVVTISTTGAEDGQIATLTLNNKTYTSSVSSDVATFTISSADLQAITDATTQTMLVDVSDLAGNPAVQASSDFDVDKTVPELDNISITTNNSNAPLTKVGDEITLTFEASETIVPTVYIGAGVVAPVYDSENQQWVATYITTEDDDSGDIEFTIDFEDLAGNIGDSVTETTEGEVVTLDNTAPRLTLVTMASDNSNDGDLAKVGNDIILLFTATEPITPTVTLGGSSANPINIPGTNFWQVSYTLTNDDEEGDIPFTIDYVDRAGNEGTQVTSTTSGNKVSFDKTIPTLVITSDAGLLRSGDSATLTFTFSEPVTGFTRNDITLSTGSVSDFANADSGLGQLFTATFTHSGNAASSADITVKVNKYKDLSGNANTEASTLQITLNTPPSGAPVSRSFTQDDADIEIDLTEGVTDPDGDELSVSDFVIEYSLGDNEGTDYQEVTDPEILAEFEKVVKTSSLTGNKLQLNLSQSNFLTGLETGKIRLSYNITDGTISIPVSTEIPITGKNDAPSAQDEVETQTVVLEEDGTVKKDAEGNDILQTIEEGVKVVAAVEGSDPDRGDTIAYELAPETSVSEGVLTFNDDGSYTFIPEDHFYGEVEFEYYVKDSFGVQKGPYKVTIVIAESPDDDGIPTNLETLGKSTDIDGDGIPDRKQNNISHFPMTSYDEFLAAKAWANGEGGTQPAQSNYGAILVGSISDRDGQFDGGNYKSDPNAKLKDLGIVAVPEDIQETFEYKADLYQFSIIPEPGKELTDLDENPENGLQTRIVLDLPTGIEATTYIKKDTLGNFFSFKDDQDLSTWDDGATLIDTDEDGLIDRIVVTLTDNARGDNDPIEGRFTDPGGLGLVKPIIDNVTTDSFAEGQAVGAALYDVNEKYSETDFDLEGDDLIYSLTDSNTAFVLAAVTINSETGIISVKDKDAFDFETFVDDNGVAELEVSVSVTDPFGYSDTALITIPITNVDEYPRIINGTDVEFLEQQESTVVVIDLETLPDYQDTTEFSIVTGKDGAFMNVDAVTGELRFNAKTFFQEKATYEVDIQATDISGKSDTATFQITILPLDDDGDGIDNYTDNCINIANSDQLDTDGDGIGDVCDTDDDGDGISDDNELSCGSDPLDALDTPIDTDGNGLPNCLDTDDDNDTVLDLVDAFPLDINESVDTDADGIGNNADRDDDADGWLDLDELAEGTDPLDKDSVPVDTDGDGIGNVIDTDDDADGWLDLDELAEGTDPLDKNSVPVDTDGDGIGNVTDTDDDSDGLSDVNEVTAGTDPLDPDSDNDGVIDATEVTDGTNPLDPCSLVLAHQTLQEGISNWDRLDCDGDGIQNQYELQASSSTTSRDLTKVYQALDTDGDGLFNYQDTDDDGDGILTAYEFPDANGDGIPDDALDSDGEAVPNYLDTDDDGDGILTAYEYPDANGDGIPDDALDSDGEAVPNYLDVDDDNDGVLTIEEALSTDDPESYLDTDGDGIPNYLDVDDDNDGISSLLESELGTNDLSVDTDSDGVKDGVEYYEDSTNPLDPCSLVVAHQTEAQGIAIWNAGDCDSDGVLNKQEVLDSFDVDEDGIPNYLDVDDDNDLLTTEEELILGTDYYKVDTDSDGVIDGVEYYEDGTDPLDPCSLVVAHQTEAQGIALWNAGDCDLDGLSNEQEALLDSDGDGLWNYEDSDDDGDGLATSLENPDPDQNGSSDDSYDADNDGIPDYLDANKYRSSATVATDLEIYNALSPNGDGLNDVFTIRNIEKYPDNELTIFNRWGMKLYQMSSYGQSNRYFTGQNANGKPLPEGVYYYILMVREGSKTQTFKGYLYINR